MNIMYEFFPYMTNDDSVGLYNPEFNDIYHSAFGAVIEAYEKFVCPSLKYIDNFNKNVRVLDICYGIGYNTKVFLNELLKNKETDKNFYIDCVDTDKVLFELSPFIKNKIDFINKLRYKKLLYKNINNYYEAKKIVSLKQKNLNYKINTKVNKIILLNLIKNFGVEFLSEESKKNLVKKENLPFFDKDILIFMKNLLKSEVYLLKKENKSTFVHNIYYGYISKRIKNTKKRLYFENFDINFYPTDIRQYLLNHSTSYDIIFLDGFTPAKCPCIWSVEFFKELFNHINSKGIIVTYNMSAPVRFAMKEAGFYIGNIISNDNKNIGTIASKTKDNIFYPLSIEQEGLLNTKAGIPYRDENLILENDKILLNRIHEVEDSNLISSSKYLKGCSK